MDTVDSAVIVIKAEDDAECISVHSTVGEDGNEPSPPSMLPLHGLQSMFDTIDYLIVQDGYQCAACPELQRRSFPDMPTLRRHMVRHVTAEAIGAEKELRCNHCNRTFERIEHLRKHLLEVLKEEYGGSRISDSEDDKDEGSSATNADPVIYIVKKGRLTCSACDAEFGPVTRWNKEKFKLHAGEAHWKPPQHKCDECGKRFYHLDKLERHIRRHEEALEVGWMGSQPSTSASAIVKVEEPDPIDSTLTMDEQQDPMDISATSEIHIKVEAQDDEQPLDFLVKEEPVSDSQSSHFDSESNDSDSDYDRKTRKKKKPTVKKSTVPVKVINGEGGSIILACSLCDEGFLVQELLDRHMATKHDDRVRPFKCSKCSKTYLTNGNLQEHIRMAHTGLKFSCKECGINLSTKSSWKRHIKGHTEEGFCCDICKEKFSSHTVMVKHKKRVHDKIARNFICLDCGSTFDDNASLREHRVSHTNERRWECETCGQKFKRNHNLNNHRKTHLVEKKPLPTFKCQECDEEFTSKLALAAHRYVHGRYCCKICKLTFDTQSDLMTHRKDVHKLIKHTGTVCRSCDIRFENSEELLKHRNEVHANDPMLECDVCKATYPTPAALRTHKRFHNRVTLYNCPNCAEVFNSPLLLDKHLKEAHKDEKNHVCDLCGKGFPTRKQIAAHMERHRNPKKSRSGVPGSFICDLCGKEFRFQMTLKRHVFNTHTHHNNFKCDQCDKVFASLENLKLHLRSHSDEQSIICELCGRSFPQLYRLKVHMESHMREGNEYRCHICSRTCRDPERLEKHMKLHTGETQFKCNLCQRPFVTKRHLKLHMQRTHEAEFNCPQCDKVFPSKMKMMLHVKIHEFPHFFECPKCYSCVKDKKTLARHMKVHDNEGIRVPCQYCPLTFVTKKTRRKHERRMHGDQQVQLVGHPMAEEEDRDGSEEDEEFDFGDVDMMDLEAHEDEVSVG